MADTNPPSIPAPQNPYGELAIPQPTDTSATHAEEQGLLQKGVAPSFWGSFFQDVNSAIGPDSFGPTASIFRGGELESAGDRSRGRGDQMLTPDQANAQYPGLAVPFKDAVYPLQAQMIAENQRSRDQNAAFRSRGGDLGWGGRLASAALLGVGTGLVSGLNPVAAAGGFAAGLTFGTGGLAGLDPAMLALSGITAGASSAAFNALGLTTRLGKLGRLALTYGEQFGVNVAGEVPGIIERRKEQEKPISAEEMVSGAAIGAVAGTGLHYAIDSIFARAKKAIADVPPAAKLQNAGEALNQHLNGDKVDMSPAAGTQILRDIGATAGGGMGDYRYAPLESPHDTYYHVAVNPDAGNLSQMSQEYGGIVGSQNPARANNIAGIPESAHEGHVIESRLSPDASVPHADEPLRNLFSKDLDTSEILDKMKGILGDNKRFDIYEPMLKQALEDGHSLGDVFNAFHSMGQNRITPENVYYTHDFNKIMDGLGHDGMASTVRIGDQPIDNQVHVWNQDKLIPENIVPADRSKVPTYPDAPETQAYNPHDEANGRFYDAESNQRIEAAAHSRDPAIEPITPEAERRSETSEEAGKMSDRILSDADEREREVRQQLAEAAKEPGKEYLNDEVKDADREFEKDMLEVKALRQMGECMVQNIV